MGLELNENWYNELSEFEIKRECALNFIKRVDSLSHGTLKPLFRGSYRCVLAVFFQSYCCVLPIIRKRLGGNHSEGGIPHEKRSSLKITYTVPLTNCVN